MLCRDWNIKWRFRTIFYLADYKNPVIVRRKNPAQDSFTQDAIYHDDTRVSAESC